MRDVLHALMRGRPPHFRNYPEMMTMLYNQLYNQEIRLIIFDDVQHIALSRYGADASEVIKLLAKVTNAEIVLCGLNKGTVRVATENDQVKLLRLEHLRVGAMPYPTGPDDAFVGLLHGLEPYMPFDQRSALAELDLAQRLHHQTKGVVGALKSLLRMASVYALEYQLPCVDQSVLAEALTARMPEEPNFMIGANLRPAPPQTEAA